MSTTLRAGLAALLLTTAVTAMAGPAAAATDSGSSTTSGSSSVQELARTAYCLVFAITAGSSRPCALTP
ncbi:hypothetical protein [Nocardia huaxiensis]|uniref:hypothetical protein n=1 Tax=Nocardia huaxiensis TaxID=2755382 RepID=UPI001E45ABD2|nr:hypothetical protein [Nocardia huaxiensis]UFS97474.1 hypothetical protein LPY97_06075 [Nocardia huaxiensis]